jgi:hypothetical protein
VIFGLVTASVGVWPAITGAGALGSVSGGGPEGVPATV